MDGPRIGGPAAGPHGAQRLRPIALDGLPLGLGTLKALEDGGGLILRAYEPRGARGTARLALPDGWTLESAADLLERPAGAPELGFGPFQVRTWRIGRAG